MSAGSAAGGVAVLGGITILGEAVAMALVGVVLAVVVIAGCVVWTLVYMVKHPIKTPEGWRTFLVGGTALTVLPFALMQVLVFHGRSEVNPNLFESIVGMSCFALLVWIVLSGLPRLYEHCQGKSSSRTPRFSSLRDPWWS